MRFREEDYLRAFPRSEKVATKVTVKEEPGNVIEEAEQPKKTPDPASEDHGPEPYNGGDQNGDAGCSESDSE